VRRVLKNIHQTEDGRVIASSAMRAINLVGDRWTLLILYSAFLGVRRFDDFRHATGMARSLLVGRLKRLEAAGVLRRSLYQQRPERYEYRLTPMGADFFVTAFIILRWEKIWHYDVATPSHRMVHTPCGREFTPRVVCAHCNEELLGRDVTVVPGPGAGFDPRPAPRMNRRSALEAEEGQSLHPMLERSVEIIGDRWNAFTIAMALSGKRKFKEFQETVPVASNILADRLARLVKLNILTRNLYQERPERFEYRLTPMGRDLFPLIASLIIWSDRWLAGPEGPPDIVTHKCGAELKLRLECDQCGKALKPGSAQLPA